MTKLSGRNSDSQYTQKVESLNSINDKVVQEGIQYLKGGNTEKALALFNIAIKFAPESSDNHLLAATANHILFLSGGNPEMKDKAEIGYNLAIKFKEYNPFAWGQLARLHFAAGRTNQAFFDYSQAVNLEPDNQEYLLGLGETSYLTGNMKVAIWAIDQIKDDSFNKAAVLKLRAILANNTGNHDAAKNYLVAFSGATGVTAKDVQKLSYKFETVKSRLNDVSNDQSLMPGGTDGDKYRKPLEKKSMKLASSATDGQIYAQKSDLTKDLALKDGLDNVANNVANNVDTVKSLESKAWNDCDQVIASGSAIAPLMRLDQSSQIEETYLLQPLAKPCSGLKNPAMVVMDAVIIRAEDQDDHTYGVNLLQSLNVFYGNIISTVTASGTAVANSQAIGAGIGIGSSVGGSGISATALNYSLNIANALYSRNEIIARPTLMALDRTPATFFSGSTYSIAVGGRAPGSVSQLVDKPVGISVSITPTVIDDETVLMTTRIIRTYVVTPGASILNADLAVSRVSTSASLIAKYGQSIAIGGLSEKELQVNDQGVPLLLDIPVVNLLFSNYTKSYFNRKILILVTPRKPIIDENDVLAVQKELEQEKDKNLILKKYSFYKRAEQFYSKLALSNPNLDSALKSIDQMQLFKTFDKDELDYEVRFRKSTVQRMIRDLADLLIH